MNINTIFMESKSSLKLLLPDVYLSAVDHSRPGNKLLKFILELYRLFPYL